MLRFRRNSIYIGIESDRLAFVRLSHSLRAHFHPRVEEHHAVVFDDRKDEAELIQQLRQELARPEWHGGRSHVVLNDSLSRYFTAEAPSEARNLLELDLSAMARFEDIYGEPSDNWTIRIDSPVFSSHQFGCAIRQSLGRDLAELCNDVKSPLQSLRPFSIAELGRIKRLLPNDGSWLAIRGRSELWFGQRCRNGWLHIEQHPFEGEFAMEFARLSHQVVRRASVGRTEIANRVLLAGFNTDLQAKNHLPSWSVSNLSHGTWPGQSALWSETYRMALAPVWPTSTHGH